MTRARSAIRKEVRKTAKKIDYASMFTKRTDGRYQGYWHELDRNGDPTGKRHAICDRDPEKLFFKIQEKETPAKRPLSAVAAEWEKQYRQTVKDRTWKNFSPHYADIVKTYGKRAVESITAKEITQDLLAAKAKGLGKTVVNSRRVIWNGILNYAVAEGFAPYNPALSVKLPKGLKQGKRAAPEDDVIKIIMAGADDMSFGFIPFFLLCTGCRRNEALQRRKDDVNTKTWELAIPKAKTAAGVRTVPIIQPLREPLKRWMAAHPGEWLFPYIPYNGRTGEYMTDSNWETAWANYCAAHGLADQDGKPAIGAHHLRHGTATLLYEAGVDVYTAQHILGHANVSTTMEIYTDLRRKHETKNVKKFSRSMAKMIAKEKGKTE